MGRDEASNTISVSSGDTHRFHSPVALFNAGPSRSGSSNDASAVSARYRSPWPRPPSRDEAKKSVPEEVTTGEYSAAAELIESRSVSGSPISRYRQMSPAVVADDELFECGMSEDRRKPFLPGDGVELGWNIMMRTLQGQGPKFQSVLATPVYFDFDDLVVSGRGTA